MSGYGRSATCPTLPSLLPTFTSYCQHALRVLESAGYRVGMLSQPDWRSCEPWRQFGRRRGDEDGPANRQPNGQPEDPAILFSAWRHGGSLNPQKLQGLQPAEFVEAGIRDRLVAT
ncbi:MAG: hypothetical protein FJ271_22270 [Planctomycetes bacterium]|nr:hypothetical protein [Planctomycetota bacterium]